MFIISLNEICDVLLTTSKAIFPQIMRGFEEVSFFIFFFKSDFSENVDYVWIVYCS